MGLLQNLINRNKPKGPREEVLDEDFNPLNLASTAFISRPPPLDAKIEQELRKACAVILSDLKPSGYDVEDTRMRSDMLLDEAEREGSQYSNPASATRQSADPKVVPQQAKPARFSNPNQVSLPAATVQLAAAPPPRSLNPLKATRESVRLSTSTKAQIASLMAPLELPLAPASTQAPISRQDISSPITPLTDLPPGSSSSMATTIPSRYTSDSPKSPSIPSSKHKLISLQEAQAQRLQESQQALRSQTVTSHRREESLAPKSPSALQPRGFFRTESMTSQTSRPELGHSASGSRSINDRPTAPRRAESSSSIEVKIPPVPPLNAARAAAKPDTGRLEGDASARVMQQKLSNGIVKDKSDELGSNSRTRTLPSVPNADAYIRSLQQNGTRTASLTGQRAASLTSHIKQPSHGILKNPNDASVATLDSPRGIAGRGGASGLSTSGVQGGPTVRDGAPGPSRRTVDPEPGDFDSLMSFMRKESQKTPAAPPVAGSSSQHTASNSVSAARSHGHAQVQSPSRASISSTISKRGPAIPARVSSRTSSMVNTSHPTGLATSASALGSRSNTLRNQPHPLEQHQILSVPSRATNNVNASPPKSPLGNNGRIAESASRSSDDEDDNASPRSPATQQVQHTVDIVYHSPPDATSRQSQSGNGGPVYMTGFGGGTSGQSISSGKDRRGLKKIFWRLGGGDMPVRKKIYVPPAQQYGQYAGHPEYDENYWSDEESCAAPVVAFGRGW